MTSLLVLTGGSTLLAFLSLAHSGNGIRKDGKVHWDVALIALTVGLILFSGLRTSYNDTRAYISGFQNAEPLSVFLSDSDNLQFLHNPLFYLVQSALRSLTENYHIFLMLFAIFDLVVFIWFLRKYSGNNFPYTVLFFICIGNYMFSLAAIKQATAMAIICFAIDQMNKRKWVWFVLFVLLAGLIHTYALMFLVIPLISEKKPWGWKTLLLCGATLFVMLTFESTISSALAFADQAGKSVATYEVFDGNRMNTFRVAVYSVVPALALVFRNRIMINIEDENTLFVNLSIISFMFMLLASMNGANMFGRLARYFVTFGIVALPWIIDKVFTRQSAGFIKLVASGCFVGFLVYDVSDYTWEGISIFQFFSSLF